ncbi:hypothetical protein AMD26_012610 [Deinococcus sp. UR1]|nr:hypothetical protein AMD26_012610 [Deinococcus sp. UR1]
MTCQFSAGSAAPRSCSISSPRSGSPAGRITCPCRTPLSHSAGASVRTTDPPPTIRTGRVRTLFSACRACGVKRSRYPRLAG